MLENKKLFLLDIDGTICKGNQLVEGSATFLKDIKANGGQFVFITNNATKSIDDYIRFFQVLGINTDYTNFLTASYVTIDYLKSHPNAAVVNLGCGLDNTGRSCDNGSCKIYNLDFPDVIAVRNEFLPAAEREENIPCDLNNTEWFAKIDASGGAVFFASGVFYYFLTEQVKALVQRMADAFPGGVLVFDAANRTAVKMIAKTWLKSAKIQDVGAYFAVSDAKSELSPWDSRLKVTSRGYMLGYNDLRDPSVSGFFRFLAKIGDGMMKMQIVKINF